MLQQRILFALALKRMAEDFFFPPLELDGGRITLKILGKPSCEKNIVLFCFMRNYFLSSLVSINAKYILKIQQVLDFSQPIRRSYPASPKSSVAIFKNTLFCIFLCVYYKGLKCCHLETTIL